MTAQGLEWGSVLLLFGSFTGVVIALGSAWRAPENTANFFLVAFLISCAFGIILKFLDQSNYIDSLPYLHGWNHPIGILRPPLFYLYIFYALRQTRFHVRSLLHLLPSVLMIIYLVPWFSFDAGSKLRSIFGLIYSTVYLFLSLYEYRSQSDQPGVAPDLKRWVKLLLIGYAIFLVTAVSTFIVDQSRTTSYIIYQVLSILIIVVCARLLQFPSTKRMPEKYGKSALSETDKENYMAIIRTLMVEGQLYAKETFRLADLAKSAGLSEHSVSQVINEKTGVSFSDFVNQFRVEKARQLLTDPKYSHLTLESIGAEAGFNSKASFYTAFKRFAGTTPGDFQKSASASRS